eukprot:GHVN01058759.1.p1 GENE.GHVN01058759.1~~GHVN01058759.1.p1  ORF type:complete len:901 (+),score=272.38 GHVN01058759.1:2965-5667(+)
MGTSLISPLSLIVIAASCGPIHNHMKSVVASHHEDNHHHDRSQRRQLIGLSDLTSMVSVGGGGGDGVAWLSDPFGSMGGAISGITGGMIPGASSNDDYGSEDDRYRYEENQDNGVVGLEGMSAAFEEVMSGVPSVSDGLGGILPNSFVNGDEGSLFMGLEIDKIIPGGANPLTMLTGDGGLPVPGMSQLSDMMSKGMSGFTDVISGGGGGIPGIPGMGGGIPGLSMMSDVMGGGGLGPETFTQFIPFMGDGASDNDISFSFFVDELKKAVTMADDEDETEINLSLSSLINKLGDAGLSAKGKYIEGGEDGDSGKGGGGLFGGISETILDLMTKASLDYQVAVAKSKVQGVQGVEGGGLYELGDDYEYGNGYTQSEDDGYLDDTPQWNGKGEDGRWVEWEGDNHEGWEYEEAKGGNMVEWDEDWSASYDDDEGERFEEAGSEWGPYEGGVNHLETDREGETLFYQNHYEGNSGEESDVAHMRRLSKAGSPSMFRAGGSSLQQEAYDQVRPTQSPPPRMITYAVDYDPHLLSMAQAKQYSFDGDIAGMYDRQQRSSSQPPHPPQSSRSPQSRYPSPPPPSPQSSIASQGHEVMKRSEDEEKINKVVAEVMREVEPMMSGFSASIEDVKERDDGEGEERPEKNNERNDVRHDSHSIHHSEREGEFHSRPSPSLQSSSINNKIDNDGMSNSVDLGSIIKRVSSVMGGVGGVPDGPGGIFERIQSVIVDVVSRLSVSGTLSFTKPPPQSSKRHSPETNVEVEQDSHQRNARRAPLTDRGRSPYDGKGGVDSNGSREVSGSRDLSESDGQQSDASDETKQMYETEVAANSIRHHGEASVEKRTAKKKGVMEVVNETSRGREVSQVKWVSEADEKADEGETNVDNDEMSLDSEWDSEWDEEKVLLDI